MSERTETLSKEQVAEIVALRKVAKVEKEIADAEERIATARAEVVRRQSKVVGMTIMGVGCFVGLCLAVIAQVGDREVGFMGAGIVLAVIVFGGLIMDPATYERIAVRIIDAVPGGKH
tara:strand:- start:7790 stop:8143 length:354 start_codon:yes stop_codon:yes gene_type:complete